MQAWEQWIIAIVKGIPALVTHPFTYVLLILIALQWRRQVEMERKLFSAKLNTVSEGVLQSIFFGLLGSVVASVLFIGLGVVLSIEVFLYLWIISILLMLFHVRYLCFAYSGAILGLLVLLVQSFPQLQQIQALAPLWSTLEGIYLPSIFAAVALLHGVEAMLVFLSGAKKATPIFIQSKRGRLVGAFHIQHFWFVPLFILYQGEQNVVPALFQGWPLFAGEGVFAVSLILLPAVLGFSEQAVTYTPKQKASFSTTWLAVYSGGLLGLSLLTMYVAEWLIWFTLLYSFLGHEALIWYSRWKEGKRTPIYVHPHQGLKILAIIPNSPAERMGLEPGEVIIKANGQELYRRQDLYLAMQSNLAFCKLDVRNLQGELKFAKTSVYQQEHHQLGIVLCPDEDVPYYLELKTYNLWQLLLQRLKRKKRSEDTQEHLVQASAVEAQAFAEETKPSM